MKDRPSKYSRWVDHPWMEITQLVDKEVHQQLLSLFTRENARIKTKGKLHIGIVGGRATPLKRMMVVIPAGEFMEWFGGDCDWRKHRDKLERERLEREGDPVYKLEEFLPWTFPDR
jgi:hypothetical protein